MNEEAQKTTADLFGEIIRQQLALKQRRNSLIRNFLSEVEDESLHGFFVYLYNHSYMIEKPDQIWFETVPYYKEEIQKIKEMGFKVVEEKRYGVPYTIIHW